MLPSANSDEVGSWSDVFDWPIIGLHAILTPDGKILTFGTDLNGIQDGLHIYDVRDPIADTHTTLEHHTNSDIFCAAALIIPDTGRILIAGGDARPTGAYNAGIPDVNVLDPEDLSLIPSPTGPMEFSRWYGTAVGLGNGQIVMIGGRNDQYPTFANSPYPEIYTEGYGFRTLTGAYIDEYNDYALYPRSFLTSKGEIWTFSATPDLNFYSIDPRGSGSVEGIGTLPRFFGDTRPAIMFDEDRVLLIANDGSAWVMEMSGDTPVFERTADIGIDRAWAGMTVLPDGRVMISGGSEIANELEGESYTAKIWDPDTGQWTIEADAAVPRLYHQATLLLADGTVLFLGGGAPGPLTNLNGEIYSPDYLFDEGGVDAPRPIITEAPPSLLDVGDEFTLRVSSSAPIETLALMQFGSATHALNMASQRLELSFVVQHDGSLKVDLPDNANVLVPGYWMLFAIDANGTPSIAATIKINSDLAPFVPAVERLDLGVSLERNADAAYDGFDDSYVLAPNAAAKEGSYISEER